jgi:putative N6-adenine-specific DNA methylase
LSLDTSGERLHKRGEREHVGTAPLRETIAAAMIQMAIRKITPTEDEKIEIVDPMMGSGTFLLEAAGFGQLIEKRAFAFENFASPPKETPPLRNALPQIHRLIGFESDKKTFATAEHNLAHVKNIAIDRHAEDFFKAEPLPPAEGRRWLFVNPPYGERLKVKEPLLEYYEKLFAAAERVTKPDVAYFLLPAKIVKGKFILPLSWKVIDKRPFVNGGIPVVAFGFARSRS